MSKPAPGTPEPRQRRPLAEPEHEGDACIFLTSHASRRMQERFGITRLRETPFTFETMYCEATDIDRPVWAIPITYKDGKKHGWILGRWEIAEPELARGIYKYWFVGTTAINQKQFNYSRLEVRKTVKINVKRIINELARMTRDGNVIDASVDIAVA
jgi:hypothetical protein